MYASHVSKREMLKRKGLALLAHDKLMSTDDNS
jgi:hypothetical protein